MLLAMTAKQCVWLESAETRRLRADNPESVADSTPYNNSLFTLFWCGHLWFKSSLDVPLSGMSLVNERKHVGHDCPLVSTFSPKVSAGHWALLWKFARDITSWQQKHLFFPCGAASQHVCDGITYYFSLTVPMIMRLFVNCAEFVMTFCSQQLDQWLHGCDGMENCLYRLFL